MSELTVWRYGTSASSTVWFKNLAPGSYWTGRRSRQLIRHKCSMRGHKLYPIANFENFSPDTLKMAVSVHYGLRYGKVCLGRYKWWDACERIGLWLCCSVHFLL